MNVSAAAFPALVIKTSAPPPRDLPLTRVVLLAVDLAAPPFGVDLVEAPSPMGVLLVWTASDGIDVPE